ncbi:Cwf15/Cwc15 cell cycle control protein [Gyrodon lividus]|nr:Cwf15/Cwc15 cell cycle control protein [Gyrodon lividus]
MSTAHRPTWDPAQAKDVKGGSRQFSVRDMAAHTKLKFRQPGQTSVGDVARRDLRTELLAAEEEARNKKRKAEGKPPLLVTGGGNANGNGTGAKDEESSKRRKLLEEALELDKDDDDDDDDEKKSRNGEAEKESGDADEQSEESEEEEDDTDELLRELEKIKRERAEEKTRLEREQSATQAAAREIEIATSNPLLNLAAALGQSSGVNTTVPGTFSVKRRWDDDVIFKNQTMNQKEKPGHFVNDLLRTEFHKKFMAKFIK